MKVFHIIAVFSFILITAVQGADYYEILGVPRDADEKQIKLAYRQLSKKYHPDKNPSPEAHDNFIAIGEAYEVLTDKNKKENYDKYGDPEGPQNGHADFGDMFNQFFGGFGGHRRPQGKRKSESTQARLTISLFDFYNGKDVDFSLDMDDICGQCEGTGSADKQRHQCTRCNGLGFVQVKRQFAPGMVQTIQTHCDQCHGKGTTIKNQCSHCHGNGIVRASRSYNIYVPAGALRDSKLVLEDEGNQSPDSIPGDLIILFEEDLSQSWGYRRIGNNLYRTEILTMKEASDGNWSRTIPFFDTLSDTITLSRRQGVVVLPGEVEVISNKGMPILHDDTHGDLYIEYRIIVPDSGVPPHEEL